MRTKIVAATAALIGASLSMVSGAAAQQPPVSNPSGVMKFNPGALQALVQEAGWQAKIEPNNGSPVVVASVNGRTLVLSPTACDATGACAGLLTFAILPDQASLSTVNQFNVRYNPIRATVREGRIVLDRYMIGDYGAARGSLIVDLAVHASMVDAWWTFRDQGNKGGLSNAISFRPLVSKKKGHSVEVSLMQDAPISLSLFERLSFGNSALPTVKTE
ncbi:MAG: YbjN domain-containing protein [Pseudomonadota bacterium]